MTYKTYNFNNFQDYHKILNGEHSKDEDDHRHQFLLLHYDFLKDHFINEFQDFVAAIIENISEYKKDMKAIKKLIISFKKHAENESINSYYLICLKDRMVNRARKCGLNLIFIRLIIEHHQFFFSFIVTYLTQENIDQQKIKNLLDAFTNLANLTLYKSQIAMFNAQTNMILQWQQQQLFLHLPPVPQPPPLPQQQIHSDTLQENAGYNNVSNIAETDDDDDTRNGTLQIPYNNNINNDIPSDSDNNTLQENTGNTNESNQTETYDTAQNDSPISQSDNYLFDPDDVINGNNSFDPDDVINGNNSFDIDGSDGYGDGDGYSWNY